MAAEVVTKEDLNEFRLELLNDIKLLLTPKLEKSVKEWLRSADVRRLLSISPGTLQNLRIKGVLRFTKVNGIHFYKYEDIQKMMNK